MIFLFEKWSLVASKVMKCVSLNHFSSLWSNEFCLSNGHCLFYSGGSELLVSLGLIPLSVSVLFAHVSYFLLQRTVSSPLSCMYGQMERFFFKNTKTQPPNSNTKRTSSRWRNKDCSCTAGQGNILCPEALRTNTLKYKFPDVGWLKNLWVGM